MNQSINPIKMYEGTPHIFAVPLRAAWISASTVSTLFSWMHFCVRYGNRESDKLSDTKEESSAGVMSSAKAALAVARLHK